MSENKRPLEEELKDFPEYTMGPNSVERIHDNLMDAANELDQKDKKRFVNKRWPAVIMSAAAVLIVAFVSVTYITNTMNKNASHQPNIEEPNSFGKAQNEPTEHLSTEELIKTKADHIVELLNEESMKELAQFVHGKKGLLLSPQVYIESSTPVFTKDEVSNLMEQNKEFVWGTQSGSGQPIKMTPSEYFNKFINNKDYANADEVNYDKVIQRSTLKNNINEQFPNSHVVEYYMKPSEEGGLDWESINLVFQTNEQGEWKLVAIVHDAWSI